VKIVVHYIILASLMLWMHFVIKWFVFIFIYLLQFDICLFFQLGKSVTLNENGQIVISSMQPRAFQQEVPNTCPIPGISQPRRLSTGMVPVTARAVPTSASTRTAVHTPTSTPIPTLPTAVPTPIPTVPTAVPIIVISEGYVMIVEMYNHIICNSKVCC